MTRGRLLRAAATLSLVFAAGCTTASSDFPDARPGAKPALHTDEAGLWQRMEKMEARIKTSPRRVRDEALNAYVEDLTCRVAGEYCASIRVYIVEQPGFNASMAPNGMMTIWTGLLLRIENEAQLATVIGHEIGHFVERHSLLRFRAMVSTRSGLMALTALTGGMALVPVGIAAGVGLAENLAAYSRTQESEADIHGQQILAKAGYDPRAAVAVWQGLVDEIGEEKAAKSRFLASHPTAPERIDALARTPGAGGVLNKAEYLAATGAYLEEWVRAEIARRQAGQSLRLFDRLIAAGRNPGILEFAKGETYRQRWNAHKGDPEAAVAAYERAIAAGGAPADAFKGLGLAHRKAGAWDAAAAAFELFLKNAPDADDRAIIETLLAAMRTS